MDLNIPIPICFFAPSSGEQKIKYMDCKRNHTIHSGITTVDGCCEFIATDWSALACGACGCHRNFHQRVVEHPLKPVKPRAPRVLISAPIAIRKASRSRSRTRSVFSPGQLKKMNDLALELDWKVSQSEKKNVELFCRRIDVTLKRFKVWMDNKKRDMCKKSDM